MSCDCKIFSRLIANRLQKVLPNIIGPEQVAYMEGKYIGDGIRNIRSAMNHCQRNKLDTYLFSFDIAAAFDKLKTRYMWQVLQSYGFPPEFINLVKCLYNGAESTTVNDGKLGIYFPLQRSCRQGCALSPWLYILMANPLMAAIANCPNIKSINMGNNMQFKLSCYADDMSAVLDRNSAKHLLEIMEKTKVFTGLELSKEKSECLPMLGRKADLAEVEGIKVVKSLKICGVTFCNDAEQEAELNFRPIVTKLRRKLGLWSTRNLSLLGKTTILKSQGLSYMQYLASMVTVPTKYIKEITTCCFRFLWGKADKITRAAAALPFDEGGLQLRLPADIAMAASAHWIQRWQTSKEREDLQLWQKVLMDELEKLGGIEVLAGKIHKKALQTIADEQSYSIISAWNEITRNPTAEEAGLGTTPLWNNSQIITKEGKPIYCQRLAKKGIMSLCQVFDQNGKVLKFKRAQELGLTWMHIIEWKAITACIPQKWKEYMEVNKLGSVPLPGEDSNMYSSEATWWQTQEPIRIELQGKEERTDIRECTQKKLVSIIIAKREKKNNPFRNFCQEHLNIEDLDWKWIYTNFKRLPTNVRIRSFSWKLVHGLCYTASRLKHFGYRDTDTCTLCCLTAVHVAVLSR